MSMALPSHERDVVLRHDTTMTAAGRHVQERVGSISQTLLPWVARAALALVYLWFGIVKLAGKSEASALASALTAKTIGASHFAIAFNILAVFECVIGVLVLVPRLRVVTLSLIAVHMGIVCSPLVLVPEFAWQSFLVPTLEGQYILKNALVVAAALATCATGRTLARTEG